MYYRLLYTRLMRKEIGTRRPIRRELVAGAARGCLAAKQPVDILPACLVSTHRKSDQGPGTCVRVYPVRVQARQPSEAGRLRDALHRPRSLRI